VSWRHLLHLVGAVVAAVGASMLAAAAVSLIYREWQDAAQIAGAAGISVAVGLTLWKFLDRPGELTTREAFAAVGVAWTAMCLVGILPYLLTGSMTSVTDALFEATSGFTTTGASVITDPARLAHGIQFWRSLTQLVGGMGVIVLSVAILPLLGMGAVQLDRAESPGSPPDRLAARFRDAAKRLWLVFAVITLAETVLLWAGDMSLFEAVNHAFTTMSTGGFSTSAGSLGAFSAYSQWIVILFMVLAGTAFTLHYRARRDPRVYLRSTEFRLYVGIMAIASLVIVIGIWGGGLVGVVRDAVFTAVSIVTTTGYVTADFASWAPGIEILIVGLMFVGGMAGSTAGSVKVYRLGVLTEASGADVRRLIHPRGVFVTRLGTDPVSDTIVEAIQTFFLLYMFAFMTGTFALAVIGSIAEPALDLVSTVSAVASALGNIGPGLAEVGPTGTYAAVPTLGKWLLAGLMVIGRLEILPILILFNRDLWRR
jgi:trk/ktr system potassium uptake protein